MDYFCRYVTVDQDDTSAKKSVSIFEKLTFLGQSPLKFPMNTRKDLMHQFVSKHCIMQNLFPKILTEIVSIWQLTLQTENMHKW